MVWLLMTKTIASQQSQLTAYLAAEGFERELATEIRAAKAKGAELIEEHERLFVVRGPRHDFSWAQNTWLTLEEVEIKSITDAARQLRARAPRWADYSFRLHRRTRLITEQLPKKRRTDLVEFLAPLTDTPPGGWALLDANRILLSTKTTSPLAGGEIHFIENKEAPSRAYLKLWELFTLHGVAPPKTNELCVDLGASPGGWTWVLAHLGCKVIALDRSPLAPTMSRFKNVSFRKGNAFTARPEDIGKVDWLFSDVICAPEQSERLIETWLKSGLARNIVCTIKFKGETDHAVSKRLSSIKGARLKHLFHNKHELTWWLTAD